MRTPMSKVSMGSLFNKRAIAQSKFCWHCISSKEGWRYQYVLMRPYKCDFLVFVSLTQKYVPTFGDVYKNPKFQLLKLFLGSNVVYVSSEMLSYVFCFPYSIAIPRLRT